MAVDIFSSNPRSFKMDRKSPIASKLKTSISEKLTDFIGNYSDDVLAEYIVVMVCNGKHQNQARDDLEAFLGNESGKFVSWLWNFLLETVDQSRMPVGSSNLKNVIGRSLRSSNLVNHAKEDSVMLSEDESCPVIYVPKSVSSKKLEVSNGFRRSLPSFDASQDEINDKEVFKALKRDIPPKSGLPAGNCNEVFNYGSSRVKQRMIYVDQQHEVINNYCPESPRRRLHPTKRDRAPVNAQPLIRENLNPRTSIVSDTAGTKYSPRAVDSVPHQNAKPRGNVWDRLGRPCADNSIARNKKIEIDGVDEVKKNIVEHLVQGLDQNRRPQQEISRKRQFSDIAPGPANASVVFGKNIGRHLQPHEETFQKESQGPPFAKYSLSHSVNTFASGTKKTGGFKTYQTCRYPDNVFIPNANKAFKTKMVKKDAEVIPQTMAYSASVTKSDSVSSEDCLNTNLKPVQAEVLDMKLKLRQIEIEMSKLRSKQVDTNDVKPILSSSCGTLNHTEEDVESRTVFVTNVHFAATKEALSLHFTKCGGVVRVTILNDAVTSQPKGAAYITFTSKECADKAVALSGTSFWSRILKIVRKSEMPVVTSEQSHLVGKLSWSQFPQPNKLVSVQKPNSSAHLQWRRDQINRADNSVSASRLGLEASVTVE